MKWAIELREREIEYLSCKAKKGEALVNVLIEMEEVSDVTKEPSIIFPPEEPPELWRIFIDGTSRLGHYGTRVVVISPGGMEIQYALGFTMTSPTMRLSTRPYTSGSRLQID